MNEENEILYSELSALEEKYERDKKRLLASQVHLIRLGAKYLAQESKFEGLLEETYDYGKGPKPVKGVRSIKRANQ